MEMDMDKLRLFIGRTKDVKDLLFLIFDAMRRNAFEAEFYSRAVYVAHEYLSGAIDELDALTVSADGGEE